MTDTNAINDDMLLRERWIFENKEILGSLRRCLKDAAKGRVVYLGDFTRYAMNAVPSKVKLAKRRNHVVQI